MQARTNDRRAERLTFAAEFHEDVCGTTRKELAVGFDEHTGVRHIDEHGSRRSRKAHLNVVANLGFQEAGSKASLSRRDVDVVGTRMGYGRR